mmetsp:Transcript_2459/g.3496  ORF Transcript_2459/g.3496 Transcript_2459/m.3496 type:complete len:298 (+) Transcript_2459:133-1026(+)
MDNISWLVDKTSKSGFIPEKTSFSDVIIPPFRFASVELDIFRGAYPTLRNYRYLSRLKLKSVLSLTPEPPIADLQNFCKEEQINLVHISAGKSNAEIVPLAASDVGQALSLLVGPGSRPLYVHCLDGGVTTGCLVLCLRKLQHWAPAAAQAEFLRFSGEQELPRFIELFVRDFSEEVVIKESVPNWLWGGERGFHHPGIKIMHSPPLISVNDTGSQHDSANLGNDKDPTKNAAPKKVQETSENDQDQKVLISKLIESLSLEGEEKLQQILHEPPADFLDSTFPPTSPENLRRALPDG